MKLRLKRTSLCRVFLALALSWLTAQAQQPQTPVTNQDVIRMIKNGLPESVILSTIQVGPTNFDTSVDALIALHKAGASKKVMDAVVAAGTSRQPQVSTAPQTSPTPPVSMNSAPGEPTQVSTIQGRPTQGPTIIGGASEVGFAGGAPTGAPPGAPPGAPVGASVTPGGIAPATPVPGQPNVEFLAATSASGTAASQTALPLGLERTQLAETRNKPSSMNGLASDSLLTQGLQAGVTTGTSEAMMHSTSMGANTALTEAGSVFSGVLGRRKPAVTYVWAVQGPASVNSVATSMPKFRVDLSTVQGINADDFEPTIVKLTPLQNAWRLVGATQGKEDARSNSVADWEIYSGFLEDRVPVAGQKVGSDSFEIAPTTPLLPGEYGVVLRPKSKTKKFSGGDVARNQGDGMIFNSVWSFQIPFGAKP
jgi:hypothetical protein